MIDKDKVQSLINQYYEESKRYVELVFTLLTLKKHLRDFGSKLNRKVKTYIEPDIEHIDNSPKYFPDLLMLELDIKIGTVFDHKYIQSTKEDIIFKEIKDIVKYRGRIKVKEDEKIEKEVFTIKDCFLIIPKTLLRKIHRYLFSVVTKRSIDILIISYEIVEEHSKIVFYLHNPNNITIHSFIINKFFEKSSRKVEIPNDAYVSYKFIRQKPPDFYLLREVYHIILMLATNPLSEEARVPYKAVLNYARRFFPKWTTPKGTEYEQLSKNRIDYAIFKLVEIGIISIDGQQIIVKKPRRKPIDVYLAEKLAKYELRKRRIPKIPKQKTLDYFLK